MAATSRHTASASDDEESVDGVLLVERLAGLRRVLCPLRRPLDPVVELVGMELALAVRLAGLADERAGLGDVRLSVVLPGRREPDLDGIETVSCVMLKDVLGLVLSRAACRDSLGEARWSLFATARDLSD